MNFAIFLSKDTFMVKLTLVMLNIFDETENYINHYLQFLDIEKHGPGFSNLPCGRKGYVHPASKVYGCWWVVMKRSSLGSCMQPLVTIRQATALSLHAHSSGCRFCAGECGDSQDGPGAFVANHLTRTDLEGAHGAICAPPLKMFQKRFFITILRV